MNRLLCEADLIDAMNLGFRCDEQVRLCRSFGLDAKNTLHKLLTSPNSSACLPTLDSTVDAVNLDIRGTENT
ncbi:hypothetical protein Hanom_Chr07g00611671 [Helianthus anomalus]